VATSSNAPANVVPLPTVHSFVPSTDYETTQMPNNTFSTFAVPPTQPMNNGLYGSHDGLFGSVSTISMQPPATLSQPANNGLYGSQDGLVGGVSTVSMQPSTTPSQPTNNGLYGSQDGLVGGVSTISTPSSTSVSLPNQFPTQTSPFMVGFNTSSAPVPTPYQIGLANQGQVLVKPAQEKKFETKSTVWADTLNKGLVDLNIAGRKSFSVHPYFVARLTCSNL
jgi:epsin